MITLRYLGANSAWTFIEGDHLLRLEDRPLFYGRRKEAIRAAQGLGLLVRRDGKVESDPAWRREASPC